MLGLGLMLFCMRGLTDPARWNNRLLSVSFWCLNIGLAMMVFLSLLPQGCGRPTRASPATMRTHAAPRSSKDP